MPKVLFIYYFGNVQEYHYTEGIISNKSTVSERWLILCWSFIWDSPTWGERIHGEANGVYSGRLVAEQQEEGSSRRASTGQRKLEDPSTPDYPSHSLVKHEHLSATARGVKCLPAPQLALLTERTPGHDTAGYNPSSGSYRRHQMIIPHIRILKGSLSYSLDFQHQHTLFLFVF